jgi:hypothetical protein
MSKLFCALAITILLLSSVFGSRSFSSAADSPFIPPRVLNPTDIPYPINTKVPGIVTLLLRIDPAAKIQNVQVFRDVPPLTSPAQTAIRSWPFVPLATAIPSPPGFTLTSSIPSTPVASPSRALRLRCLRLRQVQKIQTSTRRKSPLASLPFIR